MVIYSTVTMASSLADQLTEFWKKNLSLPTKFHNYCLYSNLIDPSNHEYLCEQFPNGKPIRFALEWLWAKRQCELIQKIIEQTGRLPDKEMHFRTWEFIQNTNNHFVMQSLLPVRIQHWLGL